MLLLVLVFVLIVSCVCVAPTIAPPSQIPQSNATHTVLTISLSEFVATYYSMTDLQRKDFQQESIGQWVDWTGEIEDVLGGGLSGLGITLASPPGQVAGITLQGVPLEIQKKLNKGQTIHFTGRLDTVEYFISNLVIVVREVQIIP